MKLNLKCKERSRRIDWGREVDSLTTKRKKSSEIKLSNERKIIKTQINLHTTKPNKPRETNIEE